MVKKDISKTIKCRLCDFAMPANAKECPNCGMNISLNILEVNNSRPAPSPEPSAVPIGGEQPEGNAIDELHQEEPSSAISPELSDASVEIKSLEPDKDEIIQSQLRESRALNEQAEEVVPLATELILASAQDSVAPLPATFQAYSRQHPRSYNFTRVWILSAIIVTGVIILFSIYFGKSDQEQALSDDYHSAQNTVIAQDESYRLAQSTILAQQNTISAQQSTITSQQTHLANQIDFDLTLLFGPLDGILKHNNDGLIKTNWAEQNSKNFVMTVVLVNPYSSTFHSWDTCIRFRRNYTDEYRLTIFSTQQWVLTFGTSTEPIASGTLSNLRKGEGESNTVFLVVRDEIASLKVNDVLVPNMDVSAYLESGDIGIAIGSRQGNEVNGKSTIFQDFTLWKIP